MTNQHHYKTGESMPPLSPGVLRLYSMAFCPFAERTRLVLAAKGVNYELVNINTFEKPEWYFEKNPAGLVPTLEQDGKLIQESMVTSEYLDETFPDKAPMFPADPYLKAKDKLFIQSLSNLPAAMYKSSKEKGKNEELRSALLKQIEIVETEIKARGTDFFSGSSPGMVDFATWPFIYRIRSGKALGEEGIPQSFATLNRWIQRMRNNDVVKPRVSEDAALADFAAHYRTPNSKFDEISTQAIP